MKRVLALILALVMTMALVSCGGDKPTSSTPTTPSNPTEPSKPADPSTPADKPAEDPDAWKYGGHLIMASSNATNTVDPHQHAGSLGNTRWMMHIWERPLVKSPDGTYYPQVCDFEVSSDSLVYKITLRERYFSNGEKITMDDVWASLYRMAGTYTGANWDKYFKDCDIKREGDTITFTHKAYNINFMQVLASTYWQIIPKEICDKYPVTGGELQANGLIRGGSAEKIPDYKELIDSGSGPYKLISWSDTEVVMERNEKQTIDFFEGATGLAAPRMAYADKITIAINTSADSRTAAALAGEYHMAWIGVPAMMDSAVALGMQKVDQGTTWTHGMFFNLDPSNADSPIANVNVRKAIRAALDCNAVMLGPTQGDQSAVALVPTPVEASTVYHNTIVADNEWNIHDEALAKEYLQKANYNGEPIVYLIPAGSSTMNYAAMIAVSQMEKVGLNIELMLVDSGAHSNLRKDPKTGHDIGCWNVQKNDENPVLQSTFVTGTQGWWDSPAKNAAIAKMKAAVTGSPESIAAYEEYCQAVVDEVPYILYGHALNFNFVSPDVEYDVAGNTEYYWNCYFRK